MQRIKIFLTAVIFLAAVMLFFGNSIKEGKKTLEAQTPKETSATVADALELTEAPTTEEAETETVEPQLIQNDEWFYKKLEELKAMYPDGKYWNYGGVTDTPCRHKKDGYGTCNTYVGITNTVFPYKVKGTQCLGFASMLSDFVFGENAEARVFYDFDDIRLGDQIRTNNDSHSVFVIEKGEDYVVVAECNSDYQTCQIRWGRKISRSDIEAVNSWYITRY